MKQEFSTGDIIKGYRIVREIGRGAMGVVYEAIQINLERPVALKILFISDDDQNQNHTEFISRFFSEVRVVAKLIHPNIIQAYDAGSDQARYFYAMEYVNGKNVRDIIKEEKKLTIPRVITIGKELTDALDYGWEQYRMIHGDIKPENIMIDIHQRTKLMDFGLAVMKNNRQAADFQERSLIFTPLYAAPELITAKQGNAATILTDIYALGASLYQMLCGEPPFPGTDPAIVMKRHLEEKPIPLSCRLEDIPQSLSDLIDSMLQKDCIERIDDWKKINQQLDICLKDYQAKQEQLLKGNTEEEPLEDDNEISQQDKIILHKKEIKLVPSHSNSGNKQKPKLKKRCKKTFMKRRVTQTSASTRLFIFFLLGLMVVLSIFALLNIEKISTILSNQNKESNTTQFFFDN